MMIQQVPDRDQFHCKTKSRIEFLKDKQCKQCGERRIKALLIQKDRTISCYNCKKHNKVYEYEKSGNMHKRTRVHYNEISALHSCCWNEGCAETRPKTLMIVKNKEGKGLLCQNCRKYARSLKYEKYEIVLPWRFR